MLDPLAYSKVEQAASFGQPGHQSGSVQLFVLAYGKQQAHHTQMVKRLVLLFGERLRYL